MRQQITFDTQCRQCSQPFEVTQFTDAPIRTLCQKCRTAEYTTRCNLCRKEFTGTRFLGQPITTVCRPCNDRRNKAFEDDRQAKAHKSLAYHQAPMAH